jgi:hypothetical protein
MVVAGGAGGGGATLTVLLGGAVVTDVEVVGFGVVVAAVRVVVGAGLSLSASSPNMEPMSPHSRNDPSRTPTTMRTLRLVCLRRATFNAC